MFAARDYQLQITNHKSSVFFLCLLVSGRRRRLGFLVPEPMSCAVNEYIFERGLADTERLNLAGKRLDYVGNKAMSIFDFQANMLLHDRGVDMKFVANLIGESLRVARLQENDVAADLSS